MGIFDRFKKKAEDVQKGSVAKQVVDKDKKPSKKKAKDTKKVETKKEKRAIQLVSKKATATLIAPIVTEKTAQLSDSGVMVFRVAANANKNSIRDAFKEIYKVTPVKVNIMHVRGNAMRFGHLRGRTKDIKKAMIKLPEGTRIDIFEGV